MKMTIVFLRVLVTFWWLLTTKQDFERLKPARKGQKMHASSSSPSKKSLWDEVPPSTSSYQGDRWSKWWKKALFTFFPSLERTNGLMGASGRPRKTLLVQVLVVPVPKVAILWHHWGRKDENDHSLFESPGDFLVTFDHKTGFWAPETIKGTAERVKKCMPVVPHPQRSHFEMKFPRQLHHIRVIDGQNGEKRHFLRSFLRLKKTT